MGIIGPVSQITKTGYKEIKLSDMLNGHKSEYSKLGMNLKGLILITNCILQGGHKIQDTPPLFTIHSSSPAISGTFFLSI